MPSLAPAGRSLLVPARGAWGAGLRGSRTGRRARRRATLRSVKTSVAAFNKLFIIESVKDNELHIGTHIVEELDSTVRTTGHGLALWKVRTAPEFLGAMRAIYEQVDRLEPKTYPLLHIDAHGNDEGIWLSTGDLVPWEDFADICRALNIACENNLVVVSNVCHGIHAVTHVDITRVTPFFALLGPGGKVAQGKMDAISLFYKQLIATGDIMEAQRGLPYELQLYLAERLFLRAFSGYIKDGCRGVGRRARVERLLTAATQNPQIDASSA